MPNIYTAREDTQLTNSMPSQESKVFEEIQFEWGEYVIKVSTDAGFYSPYISKVMEDVDSINGFSSEDLTLLTQSYFMYTATLESLQYPLELPTWIEMYGHGHALPIVAAVAIENVTRPIPALYGNLQPTIDANLKETMADVFDNSKKGQITIRVYTDYEQFRRIALSEGYFFTKAYYSPEENSIGLFLDMDEYRKFYAPFENKEGLEHLMVPTFISYVITSFNDDSGHEIAHAYQKQSGASAYQIPAISEGQALVQGFARRSEGLFFFLMYDPIDNWSLRDVDVDLRFQKIAQREQYISMVDRPFEPFVSNRLTELFEISQKGNLIPVYDLMNMNWKSFYSGSEEEVRLHYLESWALSLMAIRNDQARLALQNVVDAIIGGLPMPSDQTKFLDDELVRFIKDLKTPPVGIDQLWEDAEKLYFVDRSIAGAHYELIYSYDNEQYLALIYLGDVFYSKGHYHMAYRFYKYAYEIEPDRLIPVARIGDVYKKIQMPDEAKKMYELALEKDVYFPEEELAKSYVHENLRELSRGMYTTVAIICIVVLGLIVVSIRLVQSKVNDY